MDITALILTIVGALNWALVGIFQFDLVAWLFGGQGRCFPGSSIPWWDWPASGVSVFYLRSTRWAPERMKPAIPLDEKRRS